MREDSDGEGRDCRDVGYDCDDVVRAETEGETLRLVAEHATQAHGLQDVTPAVVELVKSVIHNDAM